MKPVIVPVTVPVSASESESESAPARVSVLGTEGCLAASEAGPEAALEAGLRNDDSSSHALRRTLGYHEFSRAPSRDVYELQPEVFAQQLQVFAQQVTTLRLAARNIRGSSGTGPETWCFPLITFDDADRSQLLLAAPLLEQAGERGLFFTPTAWVGRRVQTASWEELRALIRSGHRVGSHGDTHTLLTHCSAAMLAREMMRSRGLLEDRLGQAVDRISMPGGRWNAAVAKAALEAGYRVLYTSDPGLSPRCITRNGVTLTIVSRLIVRRTMPTRLVAAYAAGDRSATWRLGAEYRVKCALKGLLGDRRYQELWRRWLRTSGGLKPAGSERIP